MSRPNKISQPTDRRQFLTGLLSVAGAAACLPSTSFSTMTPANPGSSATLPNAAVVLFQGDSITDCLRDRTRSWANDPAALGAGYAGRLAGDLLAGNPGAGWQFYNRGVSGDRVVDLLGRWRRDTLALKPALVSVLVGVNDTWHEHHFGNGVPVARYRELYRMILADTRDAVPGVRLVLGEPFALPGGEFKEGWMPELRERAQVVRGLAEEFNATFVAYQSMFDEAARTVPAASLAADGIHPSPLGHQLMARAWREATGL